MSRLSLRYLPPLLLLAAALIFTGCGEKVYNVSRPLLGTVVNLTVVATEEKAARATQAAFEEIERIENLMSPYREGSDIYRLNHAGANEPVAVSEETARLITEARTVSEQSGGAFDITFASIAHLWNYKNPEFTPPTEAQVKAALPLVDYRHLRVEGRQVVKKYAAVKAGLGGIAKGYAIRRARQVLESQGITAGIVEEGGDLQVMGTKFGAPWKTGLMKPRGEGLFLAIELQNHESIATSGDYARVAMKEGRRYHHIIDPRTGRPTATFASVSVVSNDPVRSDAWATAIFVLGKEKTREILRTEEGLQVILIDLEGNVSVSENLRGRLTFYEKVDVEWL